MTTADISYTNLLFGFLLLLIPVFFLHYYRTGLVKDTLIAVARMTVQLFLIGFYLEYLFEWNNMYVNILWVIVMVFVASYTVLKRTKLNVRNLMIPVVLAFFCSIAIIDVYFMGFVVHLDNLFDARYFVPISGMILGNMLSANVIALNAFFGNLGRERQQYLYLLGNGASRKEALASFIRDALVKSFNPTIASMAVMGLIALPGTMTGQILGGSSPTLAIRYQIMIMVTIFASSLISVLLTLWATIRRAFDKYGILKN